MLIEDHNISIKQLSQFGWEIYVECPNKVKMFGRIKIPQLNEELAYKIYKENVKNFAIDVEVINVTLVEEETKNETITKRPKN